MKQPLAEQLALVAERPEVFEVQFTAGQFGWVVVHLDGVELDELAEVQDLDLAERPFERRAGDVLSARSWPG